MSWWRKGGRKNGGKSVVCGRVREGRKESGKREMSQERER